MKMTTCEWCKEECDGKNVVIIAGLVRDNESPARFRVCNDCLNNYAAEDYDKIKLKK
jgi:hypothetical protein